MIANIRQLSNKEKIIDFFLVGIMLIVFLIQLGKCNVLQDGNEYGILIDSFNFIKSLFNDNFYVLSVVNILFLLVPTWILWALFIKLFVSLFLNYNLQSYYCLIVFMCIPELYSEMIWGYSECVVSFLLAYISYMFLCILKMGVTKKKTIFLLINIIIFIAVVGTCKFDSNIFIISARNIFTAFIYSIILKYAIYLRVTLRKLVTVILGGLLVMIQLLFF